MLGTVVTDAPLDPDRARAGRPRPAEGCGTCRRCVSACPTGALVADGVLDARRCLAWLAQAPGAFPEEFRAALGDRIYGCDDCQQVCPVNRTGERHHTPPPPEAGSTPDVDLLDLLGASDAELLADHGRWYIAERDPRYLRRNALVALGNVGDAARPGHGGDPEPATRGATTSCWPSTPGGPRCAWAGSTPTTPDAAADG